MKFYAETRIFDEKGRFITSVKYEETSQVEDKLTCLIVHRFNLNYAVAESLNGYYIENTKGATDD